MTSFDHNYLRVANDLAVEDALGLVIDHSGLALNNNSVSCIIHNCISHGRLALGH